MLEEMTPVFLNFLYAALGGLMTIIGSWLSYRLFLNVVGFNVRDQLRAGNVAVGLAVLGIFLGTSIGFGLVIAMSLN